MNGTMGRSPSARPPSASLCAAPFVQAHSRRASSVSFAISPSVRAIGLCDMELCVSRKEGTASRKGPTFGRTLGGNYMRLCRGCTCEPAPAGPPSTRLAPETASRHFVPDCCRLQVDELAAREQQRAAVAPAAAEAGAAELAVPQPKRAKKAEKRKRAERREPAPGAALKAPRCLIELF